jgi:hypothetical protein
VVAEVAAREPLAAVARGFTSNGSASKTWLPRMVQLRLTIHVPATAVGGIVTVNCVPVNGVVSPDWLPSGSTSVNSPLSGSQVVVPVTSVLGGPDVGFRASAASLPACAAVPIATTTTM